MAGVSKPKISLEKSKRKFSHDIVFDGALLSTTRASLVTELVQYFLYERQQTPLPVDQLRSFLDKANYPRDGDLGRRTDYIGSQHYAHNQVNDVFINKEFSSVNSRYRKVGNLLDELSQLSEKLRQAFEVCPEIEQVAVLFGGTVVSPKESYIINFPPPCPDADSLSFKSCKRNLFQQVISEDFLGSLTSSFAPTNMTVLISAPRTCPLQWFVPKQTLKSPKLGTIISFNFHCSYLVPICHDLTMADGEFELSGLELLDCSQCESDITSSCQKSSMNTSEHARDSKDSEEACTATGASDAAIPFNSGYSEPGAVSCSIVQGKRNDNDGASPSPSQPRFCKHQRPNYIYSTRKHEQSKAENHTAEPPAKSETLSSVSRPLISQSPFEYADEPILNKMKRLTLSPAVPVDSETDCIWYQSPIVIKGLKKQDLFPGKA